MIIGLGIDIVEIDRFKNKLSDKLIDRLLSNKELDVYNSFVSEKRRLEYICGRFSAKEAFSKALKTSKESFDFKDIIVLNDKYGAPYVICDLIDKDLKISISISHSDNYVTSIVIFEK